MKKILFILVSIISFFNYCLGFKFKTKAQPTKIVIRNKLLKSSIQKPALNKQPANQPSRPITPSAQAPIKAPTGARVESMPSAQSTHHPESTVVHTAPVSSPITSEKRSGNFITIDMDKLEDVVNYLKENKEKVNSNTEINDTEKKFILEKIPNLSDYLTSLIKRYQNYVNNNSISDSTILSLRKNILSIIV